MKKLKVKQKHINAKSKSTNAISGSVYVKEHKREYLGYSTRVVIAMCDEELIDKVYADTKTGAVLDLKKHASFYKGEKISEKQAHSTFAKYANYQRASYNLVGKTAIKIASEYFSTKTARKIGNASHLEIYKI